MLKENWDILTENIRIEGNVFLDFLLQEEVILQTEKQHIEVL